MYRYAETDDVGRACRHGSREGRGHIRHSRDTSTSSRRSRSVRSQHSVHWDDAHLDDVVMVTTSSVFQLIIFEMKIAVYQKSKTRMTASVLEQDPNTLKVKQNAVY